MWILICIPLSVLQHNVELLNGKWECVSVIKKYEQW